MKEKTKTIITDIIDMIGYSSAIGQVVILGKIFYDIDKYGRAIRYEPNQYILKSELAIAGGTIIFLAYKLIKSTKLFES